MKCQRRVSPFYSVLLLVSVVFAQVTFVPAQTLSARSGQAIPIAVLDFDDFGISQTEAIALSNRLRNELFRLGKFDVVDRGMMENILSEQDFQQTGCTSNECLVEVGRLLGAQQMVGGSVSKVGGTFTVSARLVDVETGKVLSVSDLDLQGEIDDMLTVGMRIVSLMLSGDDESAKELQEKLAMTMQEVPKPAAIEAAPDATVGVISSAPRRAAARMLRPIEVKKILGGNVYRYEGERLTDQKLEELLSILNDEKLLLLLEEYRQSRSSTRVTGLFAFGLVLGGVSVIAYKVSQTVGTESGVAERIPIAGLGMVAGGTILAFSGFLKLATRDRLWRSLVQRYNRTMANQAR